MRKWLAGLLAGVLCLAETPQPGTLADPVAVEADPSRSYAVYVPSRYRPDRLWPVIYCFDPGARGRVPVELMKEAAEKYGYVVIGSNNSRNGPYAPNVEAADAMIKDSSARLRLDARRVYTAGFSGGARMASYVGYLGMPLAGVLISGGGFPQTPVGKQAPFDVFATAGTDDFNLLEVLGIAKVLAHAAKPYRFVLFDGPHQWADAGTLLQAVEWFELRAMRSGLRGKDESLIDDLLKARRAGLERDLIDRHEQLRSLIADFEGLRDVEAERRALMELERSKAFRNERRAAEKWEDRERIIVERLSSLAGPGDEQQWRSEMARFRRDAEAAADSPERRMARRILGGQFVGSMEAGRGALQQKRYEEAARHLLRAGELRPGAAAIQYELARALAWMGDRDGAVKALRKAIENGFRDGARLDADPAFVRLREHPAFRALVANLVG